MRLSAAWLLPLLIAAAVPARAAGGVPGTQAATPPPPAAMMPGKPPPAAMPPDKPPNPAPTLGADGQRAYDAGRFDAARRLWSGPAHAGDPAAAFGMGLLYDLGSGVTADAGTAFDWYRRAAEGGLPEAAFNVAVMKDAGRGTAHDIGGAALWYARAAAGGYGRAAFDLGELYADGDGVPRNPPLAASWFRLAAANGLTAASAKAASLDRMASPVVASSGAVSPDGAGQRPDSARPPVAAQPAAPIGAVSVGAADNPVPVVLVWTAPQQTQPVSFFVEIERLAPDTPQQVYARFSTVSAVAVSLVPARYAWRVTTVGRTAAAYTPGNWTAFETVAGTPQRQAAE